MSLFGFLRLQEIKPNLWTTGWWSHVIESTCLDIFAFYVICHITSIHIWFLQYNNVVFHVISNHFSSMYTQSNHIMSNRIASCKFHLPSMYFTQLKLPEISKQHIFWRNKIPWLFPSSWGAFRQLHITNPREPFSYCNTEVFYKGCRAESGGRTQCLGLGSQIFGGSLGEPWGWSTGKP